MSQSYIPVELRQTVAQDANYRCGYCQTLAKVIGSPLTIDHIVPEAKGGETKRENLWLACRRCNEFKGMRTHSVDPLTNKEVPLFNPRNQSWKVHFAWSEEATQVVGLTATGRATVIALRLNNDEIVGARSLWVQVGWHPPRD